MTMVVSIPDDVVAELQKKASQRGDALQTYVESLVIAGAMGNGMSNGKVSADEAVQRFRAVEKELAATTGPSMTQAVSDMRR